MMTFLNPLDALIPKITFPEFAEFWIRIISGARGSVSVGFRGGCPLSLFFAGGGGLARGLYRPPPPPGAENPPGAEGVQRRRMHTEGGQG